MRRKLVALGILGPNLDRGTGPDRWERWRPTLALCSHEDLRIDRLELLCQSNHAKLANTLVKDIASVSPETRVQVHYADWKDPWDFEEIYSALLDFTRACTIRPDEDYLVHITTGTHVAQICLFLLTEARFIPGRLIQCSPPKRGGDAGAYSIIDLDLSRYDRLASRFAKEQRDDLSYLKSGIPTRNRRFNSLIAEIESVAVSSHEPILLMGPTGAGKSQLARKIFELKQKRNQVKGTFVEVNCATLRGDMAMSALFGHVKGAFTGALEPRKGLLRSAHEGVLFLDEIGELGLDEQAVLLRAIEEKRFFPVGADAEAASDFQLIAGTNRSLPAAVQKGSFREDLLARINLWTFALPGLKDRVEDIEPNLEFEIERFALKTGRAVRFSKEARERFLAFARSKSAIWSGNFRDLNAAIMRMGTLAPGGRIDSATVADEIARLEKRWRTEELTDGSLAGKAAADLDLFDQIQLAGVLRVCRESASLADAGRKLFAVSRNAAAHPNDSDRLRKYLARYGIRFADIAPDGEFRKR